MSMTQPPYPAPSQVSTVCTWHPERPTGLACTRCGRPACPECLSPASVGFHCRQCVAEARATTPRARTISGGLHGQRPLVTYVLIALNVLVFVVTMVQGGGERGLGNSTVFQEGALVPIFVAEGEWWRLVTNGFLHAGLLHIAMNMLSLYFVGLALERLLGRGRFLIVYLLSLLGGSVAAFVLSDIDTATVGASGAIFGLLGALAVTFKRMRLDLRQLGFIVLLNLVITFTNSSISWQAHLGGFVVGAIVGAAMVYPPAARRAAWQWSVSAAVLIALIATVLLRAGSMDSWVCIGTHCFAQ